MSKIGRSNVVGISIQFNSRLAVFSFVLGYYYQVFEKIQNLQRLTSCASKESDITYV